MFESITVIKKIFPKINKSYNQRIATRGRAITRNPGTVHLDSASDNLLSFTVNGTEPYTVDVHLDGENVELFCTCPHFQQWDEPCKHIYASLYSIRHGLLEIPEEKSEMSSASAEPVEELFSLLDAEEEQRLSVEDKIEGTSPKSWFSAAVLYPAPNGGISFQLGQIYKKGDGSFGQFRGMSSYDLAGTFGGMLVEKLEDRFRPVSYLNALRGKILEWLEREQWPLFAGSSDGSWRNPKIKPTHQLTFATPRRMVFLQDDSEQLTLLPMLTAESGEQTPLTADMEILSTQPLHLLDGYTIVPLVDVESPALISKLLEQTKSGESAKITVPSRLQETFREKYAKLLAQNGEISDETVETVIVDSAPSPELYLSEPTEGSLKVSLQFRYGDTLLNPGDENVTRRHGSHILKIIRDESAEMSAMKRLILAGLSLKAAPDIFAPVGSPLHWVVNELPKLRDEDWMIFGEKDLVSLQSVRLTPTVNVGINARNDWFDTSLDISSDGDPIPLNELIAMIRGQETGYRDQHGRWVTISQKWIDRFRPLLDGGYETDGRGLISIPRVHWSAVDQLFEQMLAEVNMTETAQKAVEKFRSFQGVKEIPVETSLKAELRPYQKAGYHWLVSLQELGAGGCLADDMGLGKTVMTIALLCREYTSVQKPTLIVAPTSVLFNWKRELEKFAPHLSVSLYYGNNRELEKTNIVLTSYALLRNDIKELTAREWHYAILDEAQAIKNPAAQTTKAARLLTANHRLALSGTPIENGLTELWSLFSFINPGLLFSEKLFREKFVKEIEKNNRTESASYLHRLVQPFLLRRTKELVTPELPPKTETILVEEMSPVQRELYEKVRDSYRAELLAKIEKKGAAKSKIEVLSGLMRLRQICCHPGLFDKTLTWEESSKFDMLDSLLEDIVSEGHRVLIFSQFVGMLKLTEERLKKQKIKSVKLTGRTRNREEVVETFRSDDSITAFLISIKAGGTGLNLVEADYVIHLDPWWNPAVESQASDRAYRIGQTKPVFVYKCVMKDTVEEKILTLQEKKRTLTESIITTDESIVKSLSSEDIIALFS